MIIVFVLKKNVPLYREDHPRWAGEAAPPHALEYLL